MQKTQSHQERIYNLLAQRILDGQYTPGEKLPSLRELAKELYSTPGTVRQALLKLQEKEIIYSRHGCGYFVAAKNFHASKNILIIEQTGNVHLYSNFLHELCNCIQEYPEYSIILENPLKYQKCPDKLYERLLAIADKLEAVFFNGEYTVLPQEAFAELKKRTKLFYYFNTNTAFTMTGIPGVSTDWTHGQYIAIRHLIECGCRRILLLTGLVEHEGAWAAVRDSNEDVVLLFAQELEDFFEMLRTETFDAVYCLQDTIAIQAVQQLKKQGFKIPGDIAVAGYYDTPWSQHPDCPLTSVCVCESEMIRKLFNLFIQQRKDLQLLQLPFLKIRESTSAFKSEYNKNERKK